MWPDIRSYFSKSGCVFQSMGGGRKTTIAFPFHAGSDVNLCRQRAFYVVKAKQRYPHFSPFKLGQSVTTVNNKDVLDTIQR